MRERVGMGLQLELEAGYATIEVRRKAEATGE